MKKIVAIVACVGSVMSLAAGAATVQEAAWGKTRAGQPVELFTLKSEGLTVQLTNFGAHVVSIAAPDRNGKASDIVLGYKDLAGFEADDKTYMGAIVGRYGNRIAKGTFTLEGKTYHVPTNNNGNALHGGTIGFDRKVWSAAKVPNGVEFTLVSPNGDMGFPGTLTAHVTYTLVGTALRIEYGATTDKPTVVNLTNHTYFNLSGEGSGDILDEQMQIPAGNITPVDAGLIPTGKLMPVQGTAFDFRTPHAIGERIGAKDEQLKLGGGYDHNFVLDAKGAGMHEAAKVFDAKSGRTLTVMTTEPGVQFYSGNFLDGTFHGASGTAYAKHDGFCLETQHFPDSPNHANFPSTELKPGQTLHSTTVFQFGVKR